MRLKIAVVNSPTFSVHTNVIDRLKKIGEVERVTVPKDLRGGGLASALKGFHILVVSTNPRYDREFFEENRDVVLLARNGIGLDNIDLRAASENGVLVTRVPGEVEREAVAELAVALMLDAYRSVSHAFNAVKENRWRERHRFMGYELKGKKVGVVGLGNIGRRVAEILGKGFGAEILGYDPYVDRDSLKDVEVVLTDFETLLRESDIVTLHAPLTDETWHMIDSKAIGLMKQGAMLVNTARGGLVDTQALVEALKAGRIRYAALDVVEGDYVDAGHPLLQLENVVVTPHIGAYTYESMRGIDESVAEAVEAVVKGMRPSTVANPDVFDKGVRTFFHNP